MTPREIALLTIAKLEHGGHQLTQADQREIERSVNADIARRDRFREMMRAPAYQWKKPAPRRSIWDYSTCNLCVLSKFPLFTFTEL